ncbi:MAG: DUF2946 domain-containing protein [Burkholderiales bacterium]|nr:DUF2946 domain-containing protein [Burkholderiales bacterium]
MHRLRTSSRLIHLVLAWFALTLGAAVLSPVVHPKSMQPVCSDGGVKLIAVDHEGRAGNAGHTLDCPLCLPWHASSPPLGAATQAAAQIAQALPLRPATLPAVRAGAPLPARGPPSFG